MVSVGSSPSSGNFENDLDAIGSHLDKDASCYILFKSDKSNSQGREWMLFFYCPDIVKVKEKMIYASSFSTLKNSLGSYYFVDEIRATVPSELSAKGFAAHR
jgi:twinfilin-like protein